MTFPDVAVEGFDVLGEEFGVGEYRVGHAGAEGGAEGLELGEVLGEGGGGFEEFVGVAGGELLEVEVGEDGEAGAADSARAEEGDGGDAHPE